MTNFYAPEVGKAIREGGAMRNVKFKNGLVRKANKLENERCIERVGVTLDKLTSQVCDILRVHESQIDIYVHDDDIRWRYKNLYIF